MIESRSKNQIVVRGYNKSVTGSTIKCSIERSFYDKFHFLVDYGFYQGAEYKNLEYRGASFSRFPLTLSAALGMMKDMKFE